MIRMPVALAGALASASVYNRSGSSSGVAGPPSGVRRRLVRISGDDLQALLESDEPHRLYDASDDVTRARHGRVPGALLISSPDTYSPQAVLPSNREARLVFYGRGPTCDRAERAAHRALAAGYRDVAVLEGGIKRWIVSGRETDRF